MVDGEVVEYRGGGWGTGGARAENHLNAIEKLRKVPVAVSFHHVTHSVGHRGDVTSIDAGVCMLHLRKKSS